jgi:hypothetical protein
MSPLFNGWTIPLIKYLNIAHISERGEGIRRQVELSSVDV